MMSARWTDRVFDDYFAPAGVLEKWIARVRRLIIDNNYWQTGRDLWESKSGIITEPIENLQPRESYAHATTELVMVVTGDLCRRINSARHKPAQLREEKQLSSRRE